jgi:hypothetical protein
MWWVSGILSARYSLQHWLGDTEGHPLIRHVVKGFMLALIGIGV